MVAPVLPSLRLKIPVAGSALVLTLVGCRHDRRHQRSRPALRHPQRRRDLGITGDEGDDEIHPGPGADIAFGEEGSDTVVVVDDGAYDRFCSDRKSEPSLPTPW